MSLSDIERQMAEAYVTVHARMINKCMREAERGNPGENLAAQKEALSEARGVVAALERLVER